MQMEKFLILQRWTKEYSNQMDLTLYQGKLHFNSMLSLCVEGTNSNEHNYCFHNFVYKLWGYKAFDVMLSDCADRSRSFTRHDSQAEKTMTKITLAVLPGCWIFLCI